MKIDIIYFGGTVEEKDWIWEMKQKGNNYYTVKDLIHRMSFIA